MADGVQEAGRKLVLSDFGKKQKIRCREKKADKTR